MGAAGLVICTLPGHSPNVFIEASLGFGHIHPPGHLNCILFSQGRILQNGSPLCMVGGLSIYSKDSGGPRSSSRVNLRSHPLQDLLQQCRLKSGQLSQAILERSPAMSGRSPASRGFPFGAASLKPGPGTEALLCRTVPAAIGQLWNRQLCLSTSVPWDTHCLVSLVLGFASTFWFPLALIPRT